MLCVLLEDSGASREYNYSDPPRYFEMFEYMPVSFSPSPWMEDQRIRTLRYFLSFILEYTDQHTFDIVVFAHYYRREHGRT